MVNPTENIGKNGAPTVEPLAFSLIHILDLICIFTTVLTLTISLTLITVLTYHKSEVEDKDNGLNCRGPVKINRRYNSLICNSFTLSSEFSFVYIDSDNLFRHGNSPRPLLTISDYINEKPTFPPTYVPPSSIIN
jgi:hypothetical protein